MRGTDPGEGASWISQRHRWPALDSAVERLRRNWPGNRPSGLVWGDARLGNMMFDDDFNVTAVMDWEQPSLGGALHDLAWWLELSDPMHSTADIEWYEDFTRVKLACTNVSLSRLRGKDLTEPVLAAFIGPSRL